MKNAHDIAIEFQKILGKEFGFNPRHTQTIFDADYIEKDMFYDDMKLLLYIKGTGNYNDFLDTVCKYKRVDMNKIPNCEEIFEKFKTFLT